jgi:hypothetical protein
MLFPSRTICPGFPKVTKGAGIPASELATPPAPRSPPPALLEELTAAIAALAVAEAPLPVVVARVGSQVPAHSTPLPDLIELMLHAPAATKRVAVEDATAASCTQERPVMAS